MINKLVDLVQIYYDFDEKFAKKERIWANTIWFFKLGMKM